MKFEPHKKYNDPALNGIISAPPPTKLDMVFMQISLQQRI